jgi:hypothetical protein
MSAPVLLWKAATREAIRAAGGLDAAALLLQLSTTQLSRCQMPHHPDLLAASAALRLAELTGHRGFAEVFAHLSGHRLEPIPAEPCAPAARMKAGAALASEAAEVAHRIVAALGDGQISNAEAADIRRALADFNEASDDFHSHSGGEG